MGGQQAFVIEEECRHDMILGSDFLHKIGVIIDFKAKTMMQWNGWELR